MSGTSRSGEFWIEDGSPAAMIVSWGVSSMTVAHVVPRGMETSSTVVDLEGRRVCRGDSQGKSLLLVPFGDAFGLAETGDAGTDEAGVCRLDLGGAVADVGETKMEGVLPIEGVFEGEIRRSISAIDCARV